MKQKIINTIKMFGKDYRKKGMSKKIVPFVILSIFVFTGIAIYVQMVTGTELSPTLTTCFFGFCTGELWCISSIKKVKLKQQNPSEDKEAKG